MGGFFKKLGREDTKLFLVDKACCHFGHQFLMNAIMFLSLLFIKIELFFLDGLLFTSHHFASLLIVIFACWQSFPAVLIIFNYNIRHQCPQHDLSPKFLLFYSLYF